MQARLPSQSRSPARRRSLADYLDLTKPRIVALNLFTALAGAWLASRGQPPLGLLACTLVGTGLAAASAAVLNNVLDREIDARMPRTRHRPLPAGRVHPLEALTLGIALGVTSVLVLAWTVNALAALLAWIALVVYTPLYTLMKRRTPWATIVGGISGALPPVIGWTAITGTLDSGALVLFVLLFLWQPPHFWALALLQRNEYARAGLPTLPVTHGPAAAWRHIALHVVALLPASLLLHFLGVVGPAYAIAAGALGGGFLAMIVWALRALEGSEARKIRTRWVFLYSVLYLSGLSLAMLLSVRGL